jgi:hypothetical protein
LGLKEADMQEWLFKSLVILFGYLAGVLAWTLGRGPRGRGL